jgi:hypothetical protein
MIELNAVAFLLGFAVGVGMTMLAALWAYMRISERND